MARSIVLRFDATCFDCGRSLSAGTTARWFGKGRVSCCGEDRSPNNRPPFSPAAPVRAVELPPLGVPSPSSELSLPPGLRNGNPIPLSSLIPNGRGPSGPTRMQPHKPLSPLESLSVDTGVPVENLAAGMQPVHVATLAEKAPNTRLLVRLVSGSRFCVTAAHCAHVVRCIEESMIDRIRDVALLGNALQGD